jgi:hypothetical protein
MDIDGICETPIIGRTVEEIINNRDRHLVEASAIYPEHQAVIDNKQYMSDLEKETWTKWITDKFNQAPEL